MTVAVHVNASNAMKGIIIIIISLFQLQQDWVILVKKDWLSWSANSLVWKDGHSNYFPIRNLLTSICIWLANKMTAFQIHLCILESTSD